VAEALVEGKALKIEGGEVEMASMRRFRCDGCKHSWEIPYGTGKPVNCPACESGNVHRAQEDRGPAGGPGRRRGRCCRGPKRNEQQ
jgi:Zn finger protein HypA/HybF involved in hydrogenase expression